MIQLDMIPTLTKMVILFVPFVVFVTTAQIAVSSVIRFRRVSFLITGLAVLSGMICAVISLWGYVNNGIWGALLPWLFIAMNSMR